MPNDEGQSVDGLQSPHAPPGAWLLLDLQISLVRLATSATEVEHGGSRPRLNQQGHDGGTCTKTNDRDQDLQFVTRSVSVCDEVNRPKPPKPE